jgi:asparagine synthetase B (glutamine-hydrolysing)
MSSTGDGGVTASCTGAILNRDELRHRLESAGHRFDSRDDGELVAHLYEQHGDAFASLLRGPFAVTVHDARAGRVVRACDRFGLRQLAYGTGDQLDPDAVDAYLAIGWIPAPLAIFRGRRKVPPGHVLVQDRLESFVRPHEVRTEDVAELSEELRSRLRDSIRAHVGGAERVGVLQTGDVYTAAVAALAAQEHPEPLPTFPLEADAATLLHSVADAFDEPVGDPSVARTYAAARRAADDVEVVLSGDGGAALFERESPPELFTPDERAELTGRRSTFDRAVDLPPPRAPSPALRLPFLDTVVTNLALALPEPLALLRRALRPVLPRTAPRTTAFPIPAGLGSVARETLERQEHFEPATVRRLVDEYEAGDRRRTRQLWALVAFVLVADAS